MCSFVYQLEQQPSLSWWVVTHRIRRSRIFLWSRSIWYRCDTCQISKIYRKMALAAEDFQRMQVRRMIIFSRNSIYLHFNINTLDLYVYTYFNFRLICWNWKTKTMHWKIDVKSKRMVRIIIFMKYLINGFYNYSICCNYSFVIPFSYIIWK